MQSARGAGLFNGIAEREITGTKLEAAAYPATLEKAARKLVILFKTEPDEPQLIELADELKELAILGSKTARKFYIDYSMNNPYGYSLDSNIRINLFERFKKIAWTTKDAESLYALYKLLAPIEMMPNTPFLPDIDEALHALETAAQQQDKYATTAAFTLFHLYAREENIVIRRFQTADYYQLMSLSQVYNQNGRQIEFGRAYELDEQTKKDLQNESSYYFASIGSKNALFDCLSIDIIVRGSNEHTECLHHAASHRQKSIEKYFHLTWNNWMKYGWRRQLTADGVMDLLKTIECYADYLEKNDGRLSSTAFKNDLDKKFRALADKGNVHAAFYLAYSAHTYIANDGRDMDEAIHWYEFILKQPKVDQALLAHAGKWLTIQGKKHIGKPIVTAKQLHQLGSHDAALDLGLDRYNRRYYHHAERYYRDALRLSPKAAIKSILHNHYHDIPSKNLQKTRCLITIFAECAKLKDVTAVKAVHHIMFDLFSHGNSHSITQRWKNNVLDKFNTPDEAEDGEIDNIIHDAVKWIDDLIAHKEEAMESSLKKSRLG